MTPEENALVAYAILETADEDRHGGVDPAYIALDLARAQVYATLATRAPLPTQEAIEEAINGALTSAGVFLAPSEEAAAAEAVGRLL